MDGGSYWNGNVADVKICSLKKKQYVSELVNLEQDGKSLAPDCVTGSLFFFFSSRLATSY